jgi:hypothetical protein
MPRGHDLNSFTSVRLTVSRYIRISEHANRETVTFKCNGKSWECAESLVPILKMLSDGAKHTLLELTGAAEHSTAAASHQFIRHLSDVGIVIVDQNCSL